MAWAVVPALEELKKQLNAAFPNRSTTSDGGIGDYEHQQGDSSHNPDDTGHNNAEWDSDPDGKEEVRARDFDKDLNHPTVSADDVVAYLVSHAKSGEFWWLRYIIFKKKMYHKDNNWNSKNYTGSNPHNEHFHVNNDFTQKADDVTGVNYHFERLFPEGDEMELDDNLFTGAPSSSWTNRYGTNPATVRNAMAYAAYDSHDSEKISTRIEATLNDLSSAVISIAQKVDVSPEEIEAIKTALAVPTAQDNAEAVLEALGDSGIPELAQVLRNTLSPEALAELKAAL